MKLTKSRLKQLIKEVLQEQAAPAPAARSGSGVPKQEPPHARSFVTLKPVQLKDLGPKQIYVAQAGSSGGKPYYRAYFVVNGKQVKFFSPKTKRSHYLQFVDYSEREAKENLMDRLRKFIPTDAQVMAAAEARNPYVGKSTREILAILKKNQPGVKNILDLPKNHPARVAFRKAISKRKRK